MKFGLLWAPTKPAIGFSWKARIAFQNCFWNLFTREILGERVCCGALWCCCELRCCCNEAMEIICELIELVKFQLRNDAIWVDRESPTRYERSEMIVRLSSRRLRPLEWAFSAFQPIEQRRALIASAPVCSYSLSLCNRSPWLMAHELTRAINSSKEIIDFLHLSATCFDQSRLLHEASWSSLIWTL